jgi:hypothetical protein
MRKKTKVCQASLNQRWLIRQYLIPVSIVVPPHFDTRKLVHYRVASQLRWIGWICHFSSQLSLLYIYIYSLLILIFAVTIKNERCKLVRHWLHVYAPPPPQWELLIKRGALAHWSVTCHGIRNIWACKINSDFFKNRSIKYTPAKDFCNGPFVPYKRSEFGFLSINLRMVEGWMDESEFFCDNWPLLEEGSFR